MQKMTDTKKTLGIYLHIPFCIKKCDYCDFCSFPCVSDEKKELYVEALCRHIRSYKEKCVGYTVDTVYFGGGTPTLLKIPQFERIFEALRETFEITEDAEITSECNPATADLEYFKEMRRLGFNRLSIGCQTLNDNELRALGRVHNKNDFISAFSDARRAGFDNISVDLMFGIPEQTEESFKNTLDGILELSPEHISAYGLIIEEGTPFFDNREKLVLPDEDLEYTMYVGAVKRLAEQGYARYEISNFAKDCRESRHNLKYWRREEYLGFGVSAHSFFKDERFEHTTELDRYIRGEFVSQKELICETEAVNEYVMLKMRLAEGVDESEFERLFGKSFDDVFGRALERFIRADLVIREGGRCRFTDSGLYVSNSVLSEILEFRNF